MMAIKQKHIIIAVAAVVGYFLLKKQNQLTQQTVKQAQYFGGYADSPVPDWVDGAEWKSRLNLPGQKYYI